VLWGEADRLVPIEVSRQLVRYKSDLELTLLEGVGHCPTTEAPSRVQPSSCIPAEPPEGANVIWPQEFRAPASALHESTPFPCWLKDESGALSRISGLFCQARAFNIESLAVGPAEAQWSVPADHGW